jgi:hypothetical protein
MIMCRISMNSMCIEGQCVFVEHLCVEYLSPKRKHLKLNVNFAQWKNVFMNIKTSNTKRNGHPLGRCLWKGILGDEESSWVLLSRRKRESHFITSRVVLLFRRGISDANYDVLRSTLLVVGFHFPCQAACFPSVSQLMFAWRALLAVVFHFGGRQLAFHV